MLLTLTALWVLSILFTACLGWKVELRACVDHIYQDPLLIASQPNCIFAVPSTFTESSSHPPIIRQEVPTSADCLAKIYAPRTLLKNRAWSVPVVFPCEGQYTLSVTDANDTPPNYFSVGISGLWVPGVLEAAFTDFTGNLQDTDILTIHNIPDYSPVAFGLSSSGAIWPIRVDLMTAQHEKFGGSLASPAFSGHFGSPKQLPSYVTGTLLSIHAIPGHLVAITTEQVYTLALPPLPLAGAGVRWEPIKMIDTKAYTPLHAAISGGSYPGSRSMSGVLTVPVRVVVGEGEVVQSVMLVSVVGGTGSGHSIQNSCPTPDNARFFASGQVRNDDQTLVNIAKREGLAVMDSFKKGLEYINEVFAPAWTPPIVRGVFIWLKPQLCTPGQLLSGPSCVEFIDHGDAAAAQTALDSLQIYEVIYSFMSQRFIVFANVEWFGVSTEVVLMSSSALPVFSYLYGELARATGCADHWASHYDSTALPPVDPSPNGASMIYMLLTWDEILRDSDKVSPVPVGQVAGRHVGGVQSAEVDAIAIGKFTPMIVPRSGNIVLSSKHVVLSTMGTNEWNVLLADTKQTVNFTMATALSEGLIISLTTTDDTGAVLADNVMYLSQVSFGSLVPARVRPWQGSILCVVDVCSTLHIDGSDIVLEHNVFNNLDLPADTTNTEECYVGPTNITMETTVDQERLPSPTTFFVPYFTWLPHNKKLEVYVDSTVNVKSQTLLSILAAPISEYARRVTVAPFLVPSRSLAVQLYSMHNNIHTAAETGVVMISSATAILGGSDISATIRRDSALGFISDDQITEITPSANDAGFAIPVGVTIQRTNPSSGCLSANTHPGPHVGGSIDLTLMVGCSTGYKLSIDPTRSALKPPPMPPWLTDPRAKAPANWVPVLLRGERVTPEIKVVKEQTVGQSSQLMQGLTKTFTNVASVNSTETVDLNQWFRGDEPDIWRSYLHSSTNDPATFTLVQTDVVSGKVTDISAEVPYVVRIVAHGQNPLHLTELSTALVSRLSAGNHPIIRVKYADGINAASAKQMGDALGGAIVYSGKVSLSWIVSMSNIGLLAKPIFNGLDYGLQKSSYYFKLEIEPADQNELNCTEKLTQIICITGFPVGIVIILSSIVSTGFFSFLIVIVIGLFKRRTRRKHLIKSGMMRRPTFN